MLRYAIQLREVLKHTPEDHEDRDAIAAAMEVLVRQSKEADAGIANTNMRLECKRYHADMIFKYASTYVRRCDPPS
jgi:hypothetical protein